MLPILLWYSTFQHIIWQYWHGIFHNAVRQDIFWASQSHEEYCCQGHCFRVSKIVKQLKWAIFIVHKTRILNPKARKRKCIEFLYNTLLCTFSFTDRYDTYKVWQNHHPKLERILQFKYCSNRYSIPLILL